jgi:hypothetical protein
MYILTKLKYVRSKNGAKFRAKNWLFLLNTVNVTKTTFLFS